MQKLWLFGASLEGLQAQQRLEDTDPPGFAWVNARAVFAARRQVDEDYAHHDTAEREPLAFRAMPRPIIRIADPSFHPDFFDCGLHCVSERLRHALELDGAAVAYRDIELVQSSAAAHAQGYRAMQPLVFANPLDRSRTPGSTLSLRMPDGSLRQEWSIQPADPSLRQRVYWRDGFVPPAPLFRVPGTAWTLASDDLADRVMRADVTGVAFQDVTGDRAQTEIVLRRR